jgi:hypothetical protein
MTVMSGSPQGKTNISVLILMILQAKILVVICFSQLHVIKLSKPTGHVMHHQFNIQQ